MTMPDKVAAWWDLANFAYSLELEPWLVMAVIWQESSGEQAAWNPEPRYKWFWDVKRRRPFRKVTDAEIASMYPPTDFPTLAGDRDQEWWAQQASWGLMQVMGAVARERGYHGRWLTELCINPELNLQVGCTHLVKLVKRTGTLEGGLLRYNGGGNKNYPREVMEKLAIVKREVSI